MCLRLPELRPAQVTLLASHGCTRQVWTCTLQVAWCAAASIIADCKCSRTVLLHAN
jgi:hypothetical protein